MTSLKIRGHLRPLEAEVIFDIPRSGEVIWVPYMGSKWPRQWLASGGLEWPRIFNEVVQPRGWNKIFAKLNFMHSLKRWAKSDYWNPSKSHIFCSKTEELVEAKIEVVFNSSKKTSMNPENLIFFYIKSARYVEKVRGDPFKTCHLFWCFTSKSNIEVALKSAVLGWDKKYSGKMITTYMAFIHPFLEQIWIPPSPHKNALLLCKIC